VFPTSQKPMVDSARSACPTLEDKIVQGAVAELLSAVYEVDFLGFPARRCEIAPGFPRGVDRGLQLP
jgi:hypothetical protein